MTEWRKMHETETFLRVKDHEERFPDMLLFPLINPSKSDFRKISKSLMYTINENILKQTNVSNGKIHRQ